MNILTIITHAFMEIMVGYGVSIDSILQAKLTATLYMAHQAIAAA
jgi:hypothetical protein